MNKVNTILWVLPLLWLAGCEKSVTVERELAHWDYEHPDWQHIGYAACAGNAQSPVNIHTAGTLVVDALPLVEPHYQPFRMRIVDNGHTIQVMPDGNAQYLRFKEVRFDLAQFHIHHLSEHQLDGQHDEMEIHAVHQDADGNLLVLGFMLAEGDAHPLLEAVLSAVPKEKKKEVQTEVWLDMLELLPQDGSYYTYYGSLTTPPCTASVQFVVFKQKVMASRDQISRFADYYDHNYRPVQPLNNRFIFEKIQ